MSTTKVNTYPITITRSYRKNGELLVQQTRKGYLTLRVEDKTVHVGYSLCNTGKGRSDRFEIPTGVALSTGRAVVSGRNPVTFTYREPPTDQYLMERHVPHTVVKAIKAHVQQFVKENRLASPSLTISIWNEKPFTPGKVKESKLW
jgi:hypothetical protein